VTRRLAIGKKSGRSQKVRSGPIRRALLVLSSCPPARESDTLSEHNTYRRKGTNGEGGWRRSVDGHPTKGLGTSTANSPKPGYCRDKATRVEDQGHRDTPSRHPKSTRPRGIAQNPAQATDGVRCARITCETLDGDPLGWVAPWENPH